MFHWISERFSSAKWESRIRQGRLDCMFWKISIFYFSRGTIEMAGKKSFAYTHVFNFISGNSKCISSLSTRKKYSNEKKHRSAWKLRDLRQAPKKNVANNNNFSKNVFSMTLKFMSSFTSRKRECAALPRRRRLLWWQTGSVNCLNSIGIGRQRSSSNKALFSAPTKRAHEKEKR